MPKNKLVDLRNHLFEMIELLKDDEIDLGRAEAINKVAGTIVESAKVEAQVLKSMVDAGQEVESEFILPEASSTKGIFEPRKHNFGDE